LLDALSSPIRREILWLVRDRELPAGDIASAFHVSASTISEHLAVLRSVGLVQMRIDGSFRRYRADPTALHDIHPDALLGAPTKWQPADDLPERSLASARRSYGLTVETEVAEDCATAFRGWVDAEIFGRWLGVPVTLTDGRFATQLEWGVTVRGVYEIVVPPSLLVLRWDFEDEAVPVPGSELVTYVRFEPTSSGCRVVVDQLAADGDRAEFLHAAWSMVLGRLHAGLTDASQSDRPPKPRAPRPKRRRHPKLKSS
jgi:DNA-binding transcriptional ArsR family regulator